VPRQHSRLLHVDAIAKRGMDLFRLACRSDLEGIVEKWAHGTYQCGGRGDVLAEDQESAVLADGRPAGVVRGPAGPSPPQPRSLGVVHQITSRSSFHRRELDSVLVVLTNHPHGQEASCIALNVQVYERSDACLARLSESGSLFILEPVMDTDRTQRFAVLPAEPWNSAFAPLWASAPTVRKTARSTETRTVDATRKVMKASTGSEKGGVIHVVDLLVDSEE
jgi:hypothetical protein